MPLLSEPLDEVILTALVCVLSVGFLMSFVATAVPGSWLVVRVVDGDTIVIKRGRQKRKVRLLGIDTPESVHPKRGADYYGKAASRQLKRLLHRRRVFLRFDKGKPQKDIYGRTLAYVRRVRDGLDVNLRLLQTGHARVYRKARCARMQEFLAAEQEARDDYRGLWRPLWLRPTGLLYDLTRNVILASVRPVVIALVVAALAFVFAPQEAAAFARKIEPIATKLIRSASLFFTKSSDSVPFEHITPDKLPEISSSLWEFASSITTVDW